MISRSPFSHCDLVLPDNNLYGSSDSPDAPVVLGTNSNARGVGIRPPDYQAFGIRRRMVLEVDQQVYDRAMAFWMAQLGKPFDHEAINSFLFRAFPDMARRNWRSPNIWYCAELNFCGLEESGFWNMPSLWPQDGVTPDDLIKVNLFDPRWKNRATFWHPVPGLTLGPGEH